MADSDPRLTTIDQPRPRVSLAQRLAFTIVILLAIRIGSAVPAAGIDPAFISSPTAGAAFSDGTWRLSYFALLLTPVFSILLFMEVLKLAFADVRAWANESQRTHYLCNKGILIASLLLASLQAWGVTVALESYQSSLPPNGVQLLLEAGTPFRLPHVVGLVAGTALCMWFADQITRRGLGSGFWVIFLLPAIASLAALPVETALNLASGYIGTEAPIALACVLGSSAIAIVALTRRWSEIGTANNGTQLTSLAGVSSLIGTIIWPAFIASSILGILAALANFAVGDDTSSSAQHHWIAYGSVAWSIGLGILIIMITYLMARAIADPKTHDQAEIKRLIAATALTIAATCIAFAVVDAHLAAIGVSGAQWIALISVVTLMVPQNVGQYWQVKPAPTVTDRDFEAS